MFEAFRSAWALFLGLAFIMLGNGLQGSLVAIRAQMEIFDNTTTGLIMAGYFAGFFIGSWIVPYLVARVGHVRVFGALASLSSIAVLVFPVFVDPMVWLAMRVVTGIAYAGLYIVCESWLNDRATNETRGQMLSIYLIVMLMGMAGGQYLLNLYSPADFQLFTVVSVLVSLAVVPVLISASKTPDFETPERMGLFRLFKASPLGVISMIFVGVGTGAWMGMGPSYAYALDMSIAETSNLMSIYFVGGFLLTYPIGKMSDLIDRRSVIVVVALLGTAASAAMLFITGDGRILLYLCAALVGGATQPLYSLCISHTNDYLTQKQMVAASSSMVMANGVGAVIGPNVAGFGLERLGAAGLPWSLIVAHAAIAVYALWRMARRPAISNEDQGTFVAMPARMTAVAVTLSPEAEPFDEEDAPQDGIDDTIKADNDDDLPTRESA